MNQDLPTFFGVPSSDLLHRRMVTGKIQEDPKCISSSTCHSAIYSYPGVIQEWPGSVTQDFGGAVWVVKHGQLRLGCVQHRLVKDFLLDFGRAKKKQGEAPENAFHTMKTGNALSDV